MREHNVWNDYAKAMEQVAEGNRQISREISRYVAERWRATVRAIAQELGELTDRRKLPPT